MKIRTDFVTNSSSSSFIVTINIHDKKGNRYTYESALYGFDEDGNGSAIFEGDLEQAIKSGSVQELCDYLLDNICDDLTEELEDYEDCSDEDKDEFYEGFLQRVEIARNERESFIQKATSNIKKVKDIKSIEVIHDYYAWGEFADLIADNDEELCKLARRYKEAKGFAKKRAKRALLRYIRSSNGERAGDSFGCGYDDIRYRFVSASKDVDKALDALADRLMHGSASSVGGRHYDSINVKNGRITRYAEFDLEYLNKGRIKSMASMVLKDYFDCPCQGLMFPCGFDRENRKITYRCLKCGATVEKSFDEVDLGKDGKYGYFCLNDDGKVTWKCYEHGYCDFMIEDLFVGDRMCRFADLSCGMCSYPEEVQLEVEGTDEEKEKLGTILDSLTQEQLGELAQEMGVENPNGDPVSLCDFIDAYNECAGYGEYESFFDFLDTVQSNIFDLFEIEFDEYGNIFES